MTRLGRPCARVDELIGALADAVALAFRRIVAQRAVCRPLCPWVMPMTSPPVAPRTSNAGGEQSAERVEPPAGGRGSAPRLRQGPASGASCS